MNDNKGFADPVGKQGMADDSLAAHQAPGQRRWVQALKHRWPTALGVAVAALTAFDLEVDAEFVSFLSALTVVMALVYLGAAALDRRRIAWGVFLVGLAVFVVLRSFNSGIAPSLVLLAAAPGFLALGVARGQVRRPGGLPLQAAGVLIFGAIALVALYTDPYLGAYLVAFALLGHGVWDVVHFRLNRVVARSYAEFCAVVDLLLGVAILLMT
jgi:hypothetical protein